MLYLQKLVEKLLPLLLPGLKNKVFLLVVICIGLLLSIVNYVPGTWLSGWDTLHPEFNFLLYFKRIFFSVWQEHQGLGAISAQAHISELPRMLLYFPLSLLLPLSFLRYFYFFLTLIIGPLGVYFFLGKILPKSIPDFGKKAVSSSGALLYLLNLGTLQQYYVPLEMFATHFATLPWLFLFATRYLENSKRRDLIVFSLITVFSASIAHTPTLFYAYFLGLVLYIGSLVFFDWRKKIGHGLIIFLTTLILNSFWLLPSFYFIANNGEDVVLSKIHTQFSDKAFLTGKKFGTIKDTAILKNFLFDWGEYDEKQGQFVDLFNEWQRHLESPIVSLIGYSVFALILLGIIVSIKNKEKYMLAILPVFAVAFFFIANDFVLFKPLFSSLQNNVPLFSEALRFPFTKFSILLMFTYAVYFSRGLGFLVAFAIKSLKKDERLIVYISERKLVYGQAGLILIALVFYMLPAFSGNLISPSMKVKIPDEYFSMFQWFGANSANGRIAAFPVDTFWGWTYHTWGYEGAGFRWFGLPQPILDREFDRWSPYNENFYWEISYAVYSKNTRLFENVLEKYHVNWLLVDESIINPSSSKAVYLDEIYGMLLQSNKVKVAQKFGFLKVYKVNLDVPVKDFVFVADNLPVVGPTYKWGNYNVGFGGNGGDGGYISSTDYSLPTTVYYPFRSLFTGKRQEDLEFEVEDKGDYYVFRKRLDEGNGGGGGRGGFEGYYVEVPEFSPSELQWINPNDFADFRNLTREVFFDGKRLEVKVPKVGGYLGTEIIPALQVAGKNPENCNRRTGGQVENQIVSGFTQSFVQLSALDATNCSASFSLPSLPHNLGYLITVDSRNEEGKPLLFWVENLNSHRSDLETYLPKNTNFATSYFIQPPMEEDGLGYTLHFDNISIGREKSVNDLGRISINPVPYKFLSGIVLRKGGGVGGVGRYEGVEVSHPNPSFYEVKIKDGGSGGVGGERTLVLSQAFHKGWVAFAWDGFVPKEVGEHVLVNNWANGWVLNGRYEGVEEIKIVFLPQLLEYLGFLFAGGFGFLVIKRKIW